MVIDLISLHSAKWARISSLGGAQLLPNTANNFASQTLFSFSLSQVGCRHQWPWLCTLSAWPGGTFLSSVLWFHRRNNSLKCSLVSHTQAVHEGDPLSSSSLFSIQLIPQHTSLKSKDYPRDAKPNFCSYTAHVVRAIHNWMCAELEWWMLQRSAGCMLLCRMKVLVNLPKKTEKKNWWIGTFRMGATTFMNQLGDMGNRRRKSKKKNRLSEFSVIWNM